MLKQLNYGSAVFVSDLKEARDFYETLGFIVVQEEGNKPGVSWVEVALADDKDNWMALIQFKDTTQFNYRIGGYTGLILVTDQIELDCEELRKKGVQFVWGPTSRPWGDSDALFMDQDNNKLLLVERRADALKVLGRSNRPTE